MDEPSSSQPTLLLIIPALCSRLPPILAHRVATHFDPTRVVDEAVEDSITERRISFSVDVEPVCGKPRWPAGDSRVLKVKRPFHEHLDTRIGDCKAPARDFEAVPSRPTGQVPLN